LGKLTKRITKSPKLHFLDPGIQRTITGNLEGELTGHEFESALVSEMYKQAKNVGFRGDSIIYELLMVARWIF
jgi:predicted AAA+ superfamily ATPase